MQNPIRRIRNELKITQAKMAMILGTSQGHLTRLETGDSVVSILFAGRFCKEFGILLEDFHSEYKKFIEHTDG